MAAVLKDEAYGHGAVMGARLSKEAGVAFIAVVTIDEALALRNASINSPILMLGQRLPCELETCLESNLTCSLHNLEIAQSLSSLAGRRQIKVSVHVEIDTGMSRYGVRWTDADELIRAINSLPNLQLEGVMSHFAMSDEPDKTFANLQHARFQEVLEQLAAHAIHPKFRHICNSGGFLDLPHAHHDLVRLGILPLGVYPSQSCRRIPGISPVMSVKTRIVHIQKLAMGDKVGYGMRYTASRARKIAVLPIGYGDGFPRVRNEGAVLVAGQRAPIIGGASMDAITVDITEIPEAKLWSEAVVMGAQGSDHIDVREVATWKKTVSYEVLANWRGRLPRVYINDPDPSTSA
jgi:alanine racemase